MKMYDIHMHIIPGVDDGSWDMDMSKTLLYMAYEQGIRKIIATPHNSAFVENGNQKVKDSFLQLKEMAVKYLPNLEIYFGSEVRCNNLVIDEILKSLKEYRIPALNNTRYVLAEFLTSVESGEVIECTRRLSEEGWIPVLAHVERYRELFRNDSYIDELQRNGCVFQINAYSVFDEENETIKANAIRLVKEKRVTFLGSDAHRTIYRPPSVKYGLQYLYEHFEKEYIDQIAFGNAAALLGLVK